jgi:hypothetical protein
MARSYCWWQLRPDRPAAAATEGSMLVASRRRLGPQTRSGHAVVRRLRRVDATGISPVRMTSAPTSVSVGDEIERGCALLIPMSVDKK